MADSKTQKMGTFVVQLPKDQIYERPPNRSFSKPRTEHRRQTSCCCYCFCVCCSAILLLLLLFAAAAGIVYFVYHPQLPQYSLTRLSVKTFAVGVDNAVDSQMELNIKAVNGNSRIGIRYSAGGMVSVSFSGTKLCQGTIPGFYQEPRNTTVLRRRVTGKGVRMTRSVRAELRRDQSAGKVPLQINVLKPLEIRVGSFRIRGVSVSVTCTAVVNRVKAMKDSTLLRKACSVKLTIG